MFALKYKEIGLKITYYRKKKNYTQAELAEIVGISTNYMGLIERGNNGQSYSIDLIFRLANALEVEVDDLVGNRK